MLLLCALFPGNKPILGTLLPFFERVFLQKFDVDGCTSDAMVHIKWLYTIHVKYNIPNWLCQIYFICGSIDLQHALFFCSMSNKESEI